MTDPILSTVRIRNLTKRFRHVTALDHLDLDVQPGEVLALLGANGSGKSTTFRLLLNIYRPTEGEASLLGTPCTQLDGQAFDKICYISESQKMPKWMRVDEFLSYCAGFIPTGMKLSVSA
ncbi:MAG: ATP-binding cassette domain-containing protein [Opitutales bacterium]|nr:ATP-binding cassette domain-containing protein [Opitutales bacterium]